MGGCGGWVGEDGWVVRLRLDRGGEGDKGLRG